MYKINNSYESEPSTSNSSSNNDSSSFLKFEWNFATDSKQLRDYLFPSLLEHDMLEHVEEMITLSQESDFLGFGSVSSNNNIVEAVFSKSTEKLKSLTQKSSFNSLTKTANGLGECGSAQTFGSDEITDQDVRHNIENERYAEVLKEMETNEHLLNVSQFSIECESLESKDAENISSSSIEDETTKTITLSINENSGNAVDNPISLASASCALELTTDLSFNGKLNVDTTSQSTPYNKAEHTSTDSQCIAKALHNRSNDLELQLQLEVSREHINERSPDLFSDDDDDEQENVIKNDNREHSAANDSLISISYAEKDNPDNYIQTKEKTISKSIQNQLSGVLPPPSITNVQHDVGNMLALYKRNYALANFGSEDIANKSIAGDEFDDRKECFAPRVLDNAEWPHVMKIDTHGVHYNRTKYTENIEMMYLRLVERNVGQETGSSFTYTATANLKKKPIRKAIASPGNRLSHLARRRAIFSSANLQSQAPFSNILKLGRKPCVIETTKLSRKEKVSTPKRRAIAHRRTSARKTPGSSKKRSAKKLVNVAPKMPATRETSKRALFMSPPQEEKPVKNNVAQELNCRVEKSKRVLFSPPRRFERSISNISNVSSSSSFTNSIKKLELSKGLSRTVSDVSSNFKRKREIDDDENMEPRHNKLARYHGAGPSVIKSSGDIHGNALFKAASDNVVYQNQQLSASHKQKLLWAVSTALKKKSLAASDPKYNHYATVLAKAVKRLFLEKFTERTESTSTTLSRLADRLVCPVLQGKTVDEIYLWEKGRIDASRNSVKRISGYISREDANRSLSTEPMTDNSFERKPLTNSSSKSNIATSALRENHDSRSAQKSLSNVSFSGRDQKNLSPYNDKSRPSTNLNKQNKVLVGSANSLHSNIMKVKRQISFDS